MSHQTLPAPLKGQFLDVMAQILINWSINDIPRAFPREIKVDADIWNWDLELIEAVCWISRISTLPEAMDALKKVVSKGDSQNVLTFDHVDSAIAMLEEEENAQSRAYMYARQFRECLDNIQDNWYTGEDLHGAFPVDIRLPNPDFRKWPLKLVKSISRLSDKIDREEAMQTICGVLDGTYDDREDLGGALNYKDVRAAIDIIELIEQRRVQRSRELHALSLSSFLVARGNQLSVNTSTPSNDQSRPALGIKDANRFIPTNSTASSPSASNVPGYDVVAKRFPRLG
ncbi:hypothetical protein EJ04DRAFT_513848 [Polyplosphaeria fusca]|uniref:Uncharacterized protein n=1 Tax=Polyplosphaeria fusca TaxID=682080 RepID=A0A9P4QRJ2_9PLEO|nr:hypothetical protein EJ04DRAFT_513848 [Polyplosphaeria fusca]